MLLSNKLELFILKHFVANYSNNFIWIDYGTLILNEFIISKEISYIITWLILYNPQVEQQRKP